MLLDDADDMDGDVVGVGDIISAVNAVNVVNVVNAVNVVKAGVTGADVVDENRDVVDNGGHNVDSDDDIEMINQQFRDNVNFNDNHDENCNHYDRNGNFNYYGYGLQVC